MSKIPNFYINAFYESKFKDNLFVIKAGGKVIEDEAALSSLLSNIRDITLHGVKILLIYGGGRILDERAEGQGIPIQKHEGRRVTDKDTLQIMKESIGGHFSLRIYEEMAKVGLDGLSLSAVPADWMKVQMRPKTPIDFGFVGDVHGVSSRPIQRLFKVTNFIACPCLSITDEHEVVNINADTIATELAIGTAAHKLIFLSDVDGVEVNGETAFIITAEEIPELIAKGTVTGGMKVKLENCQKALEGGVRRIHLISGLRENSLASEIYEPVGPGTMLIQEAERESYMNEVNAQKVLEAQRR